MSAPATVDSANGISHHDHSPVTPAHGNGAAKARKPYDYGGNPLAHINTGESARLPAFGGEFQPGLYRPIEGRKFANPAPLGLSAFALTTFVLSLINLRTRGVSEPNLVVGAAFAYGGLVQLLAGMWEMAVGNTFGATALSSYGGFWIGTAIILTPGGFAIIEGLGGASSSAFANSFGYYLMGWFIFTFILMRPSTVAFFLLFFTLDMAFLLLGIGYLQGENVSCIKAGGVFGLLAAFLAWYNALAGIADTSNSFFLIPVAHFPWSDKGRERRNKVDNSEERMKQEV
ncbi:Acetate permease A-like protein [Elsinoe fawcettii]|nr:Acetate permease A-like protein [Elsinoe fawcettii]